MTAKEDKLFKKEQFSSVDHSRTDINSSQFSNLNLNRNHKCPFPVQFFSNSINDKTNELQQKILVLGYTVTDKYQEQEKSLNKNATKDSNFKCLKNPSFEFENEKRDQMCWRNDKDILRDKKNSSSTLSLHISAYENSFEVDSNREVLSNMPRAFKDRDVSTKFEDSFEFPRQLEDAKSPTPEIQQFTASQKLLSQSPGGGMNRKTNSGHLTNTDTTGREGGGGGAGTSTEKTSRRNNNNIEGGGGKSFETTTSKQKSKSSLLLTRTSKSKADDPEAAARKQRQTKKRTQDLKKMEAHEQMSCVNADAKRRTRTKRTTAGVGLVPEEDEENGGVDEQPGGKHEDKHALANHLRSIAPFNKRWKVTQTINEGTYGVVFAVQDVETGVHGVIKVAKSVGNDAGNQTAEWEGYILEKMYKQNPNGSVVRLLDKGMLADQNGEGMEFMVLEKAEIPVMDYVKEAKGLERKWRVANVMLQMLKGIYDMHVQGLIHRDLKPDNMGILSKKQPIVVLFDLGMVRMYTGFFGELRQPRTVCAFRGTPEWASGWAQKGRDQNRYDDLIGWLYVAVELFDETENPMQPLPWTFRQNPKIVKFLKSPFCPAYLLLRQCPPQFYAINTYLMTTSRKSTPDYHLIAKKVLEAISDIESQMSKLPSSRPSSSAAAGDKESKVKKNVK